jgi:hypothetical protein
VPQYGPQNGGPGYYLRLSGQNTTLNKWLEAVDQNVFIVLEGEEGLGGPGSKIGVGVKGLAIVYPYY